MKQIEVCANSLQSALEAEKGGAIRIELCDNMKDGGTTPSLAKIKRAKQLLNIDVYVIIRPRGGNFVYDEIDFQVMREDIIACGAEDCDGIVFGILDNEGNVDKLRSQELVKQAKAYGMQVTFHRAIDRSKKILEAMEDIISIGCDRILSSGGKSTAEEGSAIIKSMIEQANGRISIMPGSGITADNIESIAKITGANEFHGTFSTYREDKTTYKNKDIVEEYTEKRSDSQKIKEALKAINRK